MNNANILKKIDAYQINNKENVKILEIGKVTDLTLGCMGQYSEQHRYYDGCTILKK